MTVLPEGIAPELSRVQGTDAAELGVFTDRSTGTGIVVWEYQVEIDQMPPIEATEIWASAWR